MGLYFKITINTNFFFEVCKSVIDIDIEVIEIRVCLK